jgi:hypothetical protein
MSFMPFVIVLSVLAVVVLALLVYRRQLTSWEDDTLHIGDGEVEIAHQQEILARKLARVDLLGKILTAIVVIGALVLGAIYVYINQIAIEGVKMG